MTNSLRETSLEVTASATLKHSFGNILELLCNRNHISPFSICLYYVDITKDYWQECVDLIWNVSFAQQLLTLSWNDFEK